MLDVCTGPLYWLRLELGACDLMRVIWGFDRLNYGELFRLC